MTVRTKPPDVLQGVVLWISVDVIHLEAERTTKPFSVLSAIRARVDPRLDQMSAKSFYAQLTRGSFLLTNVVSLANLRAILAIITRKLNITPRTESNLLRSFWGQSVVEFCRARHIAKLFALVFRLNFRIAI